ncbi:MAG: dTDP-4-dehydrorhamnose 3,5-epimerase [Actinomycetota bacterium]|nr:dTDP-4-dehydrorhamnose 3,5-epimerase [Actinomycetota bacterium]
MIFRETELAGCFIVGIEPVVDERGHFARLFSAEEFAERGLDPTVSQISMSRNVRMGTLRGLHYQQPPHEETKLVRCSRGRVYDVAVDLRTRRWTATELSERNGRALYIPAGFAHGFLTLEPDSELVYQISVPYNPAASAGVRWDDPALGIAWPSVGELTISAPDRDWPLLE